MEVKNLKLKNPSLPGPRLVDSREANLCTSASFNATLSPRCSAYRTLDEWLKRPAPQDRIGQRQPSLEERLSSVPADSELVDDDRPPPRLRPTPPPAASAPPTPEKPPYYHEDQTKQGHRVSPESHCSPSLSPILYISSKPRPEPEPAPIEALGPGLHSLQARARSS